MTGRANNAYTIISGFIHFSIIKNNKYYQRKFFITRVKKKDDKSRTAKHIHLPYKIIGRNVGGRS